MKKAALLGLGALAFACGSGATDSEGHLSAHRAGVRELQPGVFMFLERSGGFCPSCPRSSITVGPNGATVATRYTDGRPESSESQGFMVNAETRQRLQDLARSAVAVPWEEEYRCEFCADQQELDVKVFSDSGAQQTLVDDVEEAQPEFLRPLIQELKRRMDESGR